MRKDRWFRGTQLSVLFFTLLTIGMVPVVAAEGDDDECATDECITVDGAEPDPWNYNPLGLGGTGSLSPGDVFGNAFNPPEPPYLDFGGLSEMSAEDRNAFGREGM